jgi:hypothetical protein
LLIVDGNYSNTITLNVMDKARERIVSIISLPPHSKHKMQPLDVGYMKSLKHIMHKKQTLLGSNPSRVVTPFLVCKLFGPAFRRAATVEALVNSFVKTRPFPYKRHKFQDNEFACLGLNESQDKRANDGVGNEISRSGTSHFSFHNRDGGKVQQTSNPFLIKYKNILVPYIKQNNQERVVQSY